MSYGRVYKITNNLSGKCYVGQTTKTTAQRFSAHCRDRKTRHITAAIKKYSKQNFTIELLEEAKDQTELNLLEVKYIEKLNTMHPIGYNHRSGGDQYGPHTEDTKRKISTSKTGKSLIKRRGEVRSVEQRLKISKGLGGKPITAHNAETGEIIQLLTAHDGKNYGFNPSNVISVLKNKRPHSKGFKFYYKDFFQANQSGSVETKISSHAQRLEIEPTIK